MLFLILGLSTGYFSVDKDYSYHLEMDKLNESIELSHSFDEKQWGLSGSILLVEKNVALGAKMLKGNEIAELDSLSLGLYFDTKLVELGYAVKFLRFVVYLSGGGGHSSVNLKSVKDSETIDFSGSLSNPEGSVSYKGSTFVVSASLGVMVAFSDYLGIGVSCGYVHGLRTPEMVLEGMEDIEIQNAPEMPLHQGYVKFSVAMGDFVNL
jgi:opacity protein-like surface antigen